MAAKKKVAKKKVAKKKEIATVDKNTQVANFQDRLKNMAKSDSARGHKMGGSNFISTQGGIFSYQGAELPNPFFGVIVDFTYENAYYDSAWDPKNPQPPACYALGEDPLEMTPAENSPEIQNDQCDGCDMNEWESAATGRGKACKNCIRLSIVNATDMDGELDISLVDATSEPAFLRIPPTSLKHFEKYKEKFTKIVGMPLLATITEIDMDTSTQNNEIHFRSVERMDGDEQFLQNMLTVHDVNEDALREGYDVSNYGAERPSPRRGAASKKKVAKKKAATKKPVRRASKY